MQNLVEQTGPRSGAGYTSWVVHVVRALFIVAVFGLIPPSRGTAEQAESPPVSIEDTGGRLDYFYSRLAAAEANRPGVVARISFFTDSINGWDNVTSYLRHHLQARFGDGGKGWVHLVPGWTYQHHRDVRWRYSSGWRTYVVNRGAGPGDRYGFGGVMAENGSRHCTASFATVTDNPAGTAVSRFRLFYQAFPEGGSVRVGVDGAEPHEVACAAETVEDRVHEVQVNDGSHSFEVSVGERRVRLYGVVMERAGPGVVVDSIALIGARVARLLRFDQPHWRRQVELREPDLLVFWLGANNATANRWTRSAFIRDYGQGIAEARRGRAQVSCLLISVTDIGERGTGRSLDRVPQVVEAQREVARAQGCGFYDLYSAMGGNGSMRRWSLATSPRLGAGDFRHLTHVGGARIGEMVHDALIRGYEAYRSR